MNRIIVLGQTVRMPKYTAAILMMVVSCLLVVWTGPVSAQEQKPQPLSLTECILVALQNNPEIVSSQQGIIGAQAGLMRARSSYYPQLSLNATEGITSGGIATPGSSDWRNEIGVGLNMTLWRSGRSAGVAESRSQLEVAELNHLNTMQGLAQQVATDYYAVLAAQELVAVAEAGVEAAEQHLQDVKTRIKLGAAAEVDIFATEDDLARAQLDLIDARSTVRSALARLKSVMGLPYTQDLQLAPAPLSITEKLPSLTEAVNSAMEKRPDVLASRRTIQARRYALEQAVTQRGPTLQVGGQYGRSYTDWRANDDSWNVLASVSWPLLDGQATKADELAARGRSSDES